MNDQSASAGIDYAKLAATLADAAMPALANAATLEVASAARPIPWYRSSTMWMGVVQVVGGFASTVAGYVNKDANLLVVGMGGVATGLGTIQGRRNPAIAPIGKPS